MEGCMDKRCFGLKNYHKKIIMQSKATTIEEYFASLPEDRQAPMKKLHQQIKKNLKGFKESMQYGMIGYAVPFSKYPAGYHCNPEQPLPFMCLASQKNFIAVYHMGVYADPALYKWFTEAYAKEGIGKLDMGKSCIRLKNMGKIPYELIGQLSAAMSADQWISLYEKNLKGK
jgi:uncharacterized protein YdhG (YjbR/CyaY superfamily)